MNESESPLLKSKTLRIKLLIKEFKSKRNTNT